VPNDVQQGFKAVKKSPQFSQCATGCAMLQLGRKKTLCLQFLILHCGTPTCCSSITPYGNVRGKRGRPNFLRKCVQVRPVGEFVSQDVRDSNVKLQAVLLQVRVTLPWFDESNRAKCQNHAAKVASNSQEQVH